MSEILKSLLGEQQCGRSISISWKEVDMTNQSALLAALNKILAESSKENVARRTKMLAPGEKICNARKTAGDTTPLGSWSEYWEEIVGVKIPEKACCARCGKVKELEGAHVWIGADDVNYYIMPMCHECNTADHDPFVPMYAHEMAWVDYNVCTKGDAHLQFDKLRGYK